MIDSRIRQAINKYAHQAGINHAAEVKESLLARAKELVKAKTPPTEIAAALGVTVLGMTCE